MSYDIYIQRRIDEIEERLTTYPDPVEKMYIWFAFIKDFTPESHVVFDKQYEEFILLCGKYVANPDPVAREAIRAQIKVCTLEIDNLSKHLKRIPRIQQRLEKTMHSL